MPARHRAPAYSKRNEANHAAALGLLALKVKPDAVLTSPWLRAVQTAEIFCEMMGYSSKKIVRTDALKGTAPPDICFANWRDEEKGSGLLRPRTAFTPINCLALRTHSRVTELKKAGIACLELERISPPQGQLVALYPPSTLRLLGK